MELAKLDNKLDKLNKELDLGPWNTWILDCLKESTAPRSCSFLTAAWTWTWAWWAVFSFSARAAPTASLRRGWLSCCIVSGFQQWLLLFSNLPWLALIGWLTQAGVLALLPFILLDKQELGEPRLKPLGMGRGSCIPDVGIRVWSVVCWLKALKYTSFTYLDKN